MRTVWGAMLGAATVTGCFYVDPINERPGADILRVDPELPYRSDSITVRAEIFDPDGDTPFADWRAYACNGDACDTIAFETSNLFEFTFLAEPSLRDGRPTSRIHVTLEVQDELGAEATPVQDVDIDLANHAPTLAPIQTSGRRFRGAFPVGTPIRITAQAADQDDGVEPLAWTPAALFPPSGATLDDATLTELTWDQAGVATWELVAGVAGQWDVEVTVADPLGATETATVGIPVAADHPPCITVADPDFPPEGARIVVDAPRRFAVLAVDDDLDVYPAPPPGGLLGAASFRWFLDGVPLAVDGNAFEIDPAAFTPGDEVELRVEAVDQVDRPLCDASLAECALADSCYSRRSWALEIR